MPATNVERAAGLEQLYARCLRLHPRMVGHAEFEVIEQAANRDPSVLRATLDALRCNSTKAVKTAFTGELSTPNSRIFWDTVRNGRMDIQKMQQLLNFIDQPCDSPNLINFQAGRDHAIHHIARIILIDLKKISMVPSYSPPKTARTYISAALI